MAQADYRHQPIQATKPAGKTESRAWMRTAWFRLLAVLLIVELIWPFLLWKAGLPQRLDFVTDVIAGAIVGLTMAYMLLKNRMPGAMLVIIAITVIWALVGAFEGQAASVTLWGWWRLFKYPLLALFIYLISRWPNDSARLIFKFLVVTLVFQVLVQFAQYATGEPPGDSLAGTFGHKGVGAYSVFVFFVVCVGLGHWLATGRWKYLGLILILGLVAMMLSVTKFYVFATAVLLIFALVLHLVRGGQFRYLFLYVALAVLAGAIFVPVYNSFIATTRGLKPLQEYMTRDAIESYLFREEESAQEGLYKLGRGGAIVYAWQQIQRDVTTTLFGYGMGSRSYSTALGIAGATLEDDLYGGGGSTSLGVWIQEYGVLGMAIFLAINFWIMAKLFRLARRTSDPYEATLAYGLIIFTFFWPIWLWYQKTWLYGMVMICYWATLGFLFQSIYPRLRRRSRRPRPSWVEDESVPAFFRPRPRR